jgi:hypothetical protein
VSPSSWRLRGGGQGGSLKVKLTYLYYNALAAQMLPCVHRHNFFTHCVSAHKGNIFCLKSVLTSVKTSHPLRLIRGKAVPQRLIKGGGGGGKKVNIHEFRTESVIKKKSSVGLSDRVRVTRLRCSVTDST